MSDILFTCIEKLQGARPWGRFLDAGTGLHSVKWIQNLQTSSWNAITADNAMKQQIVSDPSVHAKLRYHDNVLVGNWMDEKFVAGLGQYDTILADYLIGAVDGFSPYEQDQVIKKLTKHLLPTGRLYFIGMNPIPDDPAPSAKIITEIRRARDACILLAGHRPYREFPVTWMNRHIEQVGLKVINSKNYTILHSEDSAIRQIRVGRSKLELMRHPALRSGMDQYLTDLENRTREEIRNNGGRIALSFDYVIGCEFASPEAAAAAQANDHHAHDEEHEHEHEHNHSHSCNEDHDHDAGHDHAHGISPNPSVTIIQPTDVNVEIQPTK